MTSLTIDVTEAVERAGQGRVDLVSLVSLVSLVQPKNQTNQMNKTGWRDFSAYWATIEEQVSS